MCVCSCARDRLFIKREEAQQISHLITYKNIFAANIADMKEIANHLHRVSLLTYQSDDRSCQGLSQFHQVVRKRI